MKQLAAHGCPQIAITALRDHGIFIEKESLTHASFIEPPQGDVHRVRTLAGDAQLGPGIHSSSRSHMRRSSTKFGLSDLPLRRSP